MSEEREGRRPRGPLYSPRTPSSEARGTPISLKSRKPGRLGFFVHVPVHGAPLAQPSRFRALEHIHAPRVCVQRCAADLHRRGTGGLRGESRGPDRSLRLCDRGGQEPADSAGGAAASGGSRERSGDHEHCGAEREHGVRSATGGALEDRYTARGPPPRKRAARRSPSSRGNPDAWVFLCTFLCTVHLAHNPRGSAHFRAPPTREL